MAEIGGAAPAAGDDPAIADADSVYRRLSDSRPPMLVIDFVTHERRPSSAAFRVDSDGVSVYRRSKLDAAGLTAADLVRLPQNVVVSLVVGEIRSLAKLGIRDDPWPPDSDDPGHPRNGAHALIVGWNGLSRSQRRERQKTLARLPSLSLVV